MNNFMDIETFSGGNDKIPPGACGLLAAVGEFSLNALLKSAMCLQYRGRTGAGVTLKGIYKDNSFYVFHIMFRDSNKIAELEKVIDSWGVHILESQDLVARKYYYEYDLPIIKRYFVAPPNVDEMMYRARIDDDYKYIVKHVSKFNKDFMNDARIFSSSKENGTFLTAFELTDTIKIYDLPQFEDKYYEACLIHLRWPTSSGRGLWWGPQPISLGEIAGIHNGHLSSDKSNAIALEQLGINLHVGTDSEAIFLETDYLLRSGFSIEEIEWIICGKYPQELLSLNCNDLKRYSDIQKDPILKRMKMSGPATAIVMVGDVILGYTDRDHLRSFSLGYNDKVALLGSEQRAILSAAYFMEEELKSVYDPDAGKVVAFKTSGKNIKRLDYRWKWYEA
jgi:glutamate synthase domain-containing protein 1